MEDGVGIPEDLRCKRSDGKQWRCSALSMPDKTVCEKHYIQAKKRAANSALRASLKKAKRKLAGAADSGGEAYLDAGDHEVREMSVSPLNVGGGGGGGSVEYSGPSPAKKYKGRAHKGQGLYPPQVMGTKRGSAVRVRHGEEAQRDLMQVAENRLRSAYSTPPTTSKTVRSFGGGISGDYSSRSTDFFGEAEGLTCHQCRRNDRARVVWCMSCNKRGYCDTCVSRRYPDISVEYIRRVCPACRGICNCRVCLRGDNLIKARIREMAGMEKLQHLHRLLFFVLPVVKQMHSEQCFELNLETRVYGIKNDIPRARINADEQMCCDFCKIPIFDYHRHCTNCLYDLCLTCCRDLRRASFVGTKGEFTENQAVDGSQDIDASTMHLKSLEKSSGENFGYSTDINTIDFSRLHPKWKANSDRSIPCPPVEAGGCGCSSLVLRRILKINWVAKLVKMAEEMVNGCKASDLYISEKCNSCTGSTTSQSSDSNLCECSHRDDDSDNFLYYPTSQDIEHENVGHFHKHWVKGEPVIVRHTFESSLSSCWDPLSIWRGIQETTDEGMKEDDIIVKAISCFDHSEVDIELSQFIKGYTEGRLDEVGRPEMLKLKDWPPPDALEEFLLCQRPEFLSKLPLLEYIHPKWGLLNLAAKLPHDSMQTDVGPKVFIAYGTRKELGRGDSTTNLQINMGDVVCLLMHTSEVNFQGQEWDKIQNIQKTDDELAVKGSHGNAHAVTSNKNLNARVNSSILATNERNMQDQVCGSALNENDNEVLEDKVCDGIKIASEGRNKVNFYHSDKKMLAAPENANAGAVWDVFRRQDVPKLNEFLRSHWKELRNSSSPPFNMVTHSIYDQGLFLSMDHKNNLKEEFRIEPWTFQQHVGEAVFIPAGCPFQVRNFQSTVQLGFDFLSPESLGESVHLAQEIRRLPNDHEAKLQMLEVGKMCLYAASSAIREIQKITLDPKLGSDIRFEDGNLTAMVSENLERITKRRQITCA